MSNDYPSWGFQRLKETPLCDCGASEEAACAGGPHQHSEDCAISKAYLKGKLAELSCIQCEDEGRASLAKEIYETLKCREFWVPSIKNFHDKRQTSDLIGCVASSLDGLRQEIHLLRAMLHNKDNQSD